MIKLVTAPATKPLSPAQIKAWLRLSDDEMTDQAETISIILDTVTKACVEATGMQLMQATYDLFIPVLTEKRSLPYPPLISIDSVSYINADGDTVTVDYTEDINSHYGFGMLRIKTDDLPLIPAYNTDVENPVKIRFTAGHATAAEINPELISAMLKHFATLFEMREDVVLGTTKAELPESSRQTYENYSIHAIYSAIQ